MADGMTIQRASHAALAQGVSLAWILDELAAIEPRPKAPLISETLGWLPSSAALSPARAASRVRRRPSLSRKA